MQYATRSLNITMENSASLVDKSSMTICNMSIYQKVHNQMEVPSGTLT